MVGKLTQIVTGHLIFSLGIALIITSGVGASAWDTVFVGLYNTFGLTVGTWSFTIGTLMIFLNALISWKRPELRTVLSNLLAGLCIDFWLGMVLSSVELPYLSVQISIFTLGLMCLSFGIALYIRPNLVSSSIEGLMIATSKRLKVSYKTARWINELSASLIGFLLGGPVGAGTLLLAVGVGYGIQCSTNLIDHLKTKGLKIV